MIMIWKAELYFGKTRGKCGNYSDLQVKNIEQI